MDQLENLWKFAARLKKESRKGWVEKLGIMKPESVADHSYAVSFLCLFEGDSRGYDVGKLLTFALLHDVEEAVTGDLTPRDKNAKGVAIVRAEKMLARRQFLACLSAKRRLVYQKLWLEFDRKKSREAKLVHQLDKLEMALQAHDYANAGLDPDRLKDFYESSRKTIRDPRLRVVLKRISPEKGRD